MGATACREEDELEAPQPKVGLCCFTQSKGETLLEVKTEAHEVDTIQPVNNDRAVLMRQQDEFNVELLTTSDSRTLGVDLCFLDGRTARIIRVLDSGAVSLWNKTCARDKQLADGDHIMEANGARGDVRRLRERLLKDDSLSLMIKRPSEFTISVMKGKGLGIDVDSTPDGKSLFIRSIASGAIHQWNKETEDTVQVRKGDRIVAVNGFRGLHSELGEKIKIVKSDEMLSLVFSRIFP